MLFLFLFPCFACSRSKVLHFFLDLLVSECPTLLPQVFSYNWHILLISRGGPTFEGGGARALNLDKNYTCIYLNKDDIFNCAPSNAKADLVHWSNAYLSASLRARCPVFDSWSLTFFVVIFSKKKKNI